MGRILLLALVIVTLVMLWRAFGPAAKKQQRQPQQPSIKGPDDDEEFLWRLERDRFKQRRAREEAARAEEEQVRRARRKLADGDGGGVDSNDAAIDSTEDGPEAAGSSDHTPKK